MVSKTYRKFSRHAAPQLRASRHTWRSVERTDTIETVYHAERTVKQHYATNDTEIPDLSGLFPTVPYSPADVTVARSHECRPEHLASVQIPPTRPTTLPITQSTTVIRPIIRPSKTRSRATQTTPPVQPAQLSAAVQAPVAEPPVEPPAEPPVEPSVEPPAAPTQNGTPYGHWPLHPWADEPWLPDIGAGYVSSPHQELFMSTKPHMSDEELHWHGATYLGNGGYGAAGLWCETDQHGNVIDRMVVKENATAHREAWRDPKNWRDHLPREIAIHRRLESRRAAESDAFQHIIKYRGHRLLMSKRRYRLYADFASGGDLAKAMTDYDLKWNHIRLDHVSTQDCLSEGFIWYTIRALATACLILQKGTVEDEPVNDWKPIMHLDLQLPNILLDVQSKKRKSSVDEDSDSSQAGSIKRLKSGKAEVPDEGKEIILKLSDFGLSLLDLDFDDCPSLDENPQDHILYPGPNNTRYAPEHQHYTGTAPDRLDEKTNVWGIGRLAWSLIVNRLESHGPVRENGPLDGMTSDTLPVSKYQEENLQINDRYDTEVLVGSNDWPAASRYSEELKELVRDCLKFMPELRPSPEEVLERVNRHLEANPQLAVGAADVANASLKLPKTEGFEIGEPLVTQRSGTKK